MFEITILSDKLKNGLSFANHAISSRSQLPVLLNFLLQTKDGRLEIHATDLEIGIIYKTAIKISGEGGVTVSAKTFLDLVSSVTKDKINLVQVGDSLSLSTEKLKTSFPTLPALDFPKLYTEMGDKRAEFDKKAIEKELSKIVFAAAQDVARPALMGVLIKQEKGSKGLTIVATDGLRLSLKRGFGGGKIASEEASFLIPARVIKEVLSLKEDDQKIELYTPETSSQVIFDTPETTIIGRLIEDTYPDYEKILPEEFATKVELDREEVLSAVRQCSIFAREAANIVRVSVMKDKVVFSASASAVGENEVEVEAKVEGEENQIAFNSKYLVDFLTNITEERITFEMNGPLTAGVFKIAGDESFLHIIMPIQIKD